MRVLGFDPGTNITGFGIIEGNESKLSYISCGIIDLRKIKSIQKKLDLIYNKVLEIVKEFNPDSIAIEDVFVAKNTKGTIKLGYVKGVIFLAAEHIGINVYEYSATTVKQSITGYGRSTKDEIRRLLPNLLHNFKDTSYRDASDALAIAYCHLTHTLFLKSCLYGK